MKANYLHTPVSRHTRTGLFVGVVLTAAMAVQSPVLAKPDAQEPAWRPQASERLVKLPASYLKKSLERDFAQSELGKAVGTIEEEIGLKVQTLTDLQGAIYKSDGNLRTELRHQFLAEKRLYIDLMGRRLALSRKHLKTKRLLLERLKQRLGQKEGELTPARMKLIENQQTARKRFNASLSKVDVKLLGASAAPESRYSREYGKNLQAAETLVQAIKAHPANTELVIEGRTLTKKEYLRQMAADTEAETALLDQQDSILGYMAKLVALDATALVQEIDVAGPVDADVKPGRDVTSAVGFFVSK